LKKIIASVGGLAAVAAAAFGLYAYHGEIGPRDAREKPAFDSAVVAKGRELAAAGFCAECHTQPGQAPYAGNYPLDTGFGIIYGSNLTPDPETGIGLWTEAAFNRALKQGVDRKGRNLFPAFPYDHFTKMTDEDVRAVYAYLMSEVKPVRNQVKDSTIPFPLNIRWLQSGWKLLFVDFGTYQPDKGKSDLWNRGAYLVEGVSHCGACHTPRNLLGGEEKSRQFEGAVIDKWIAPALTSANASVVPWTAKDLSGYLKSGVSQYHGVSVGPMGPVVHAGLRKLPDRDVEAIGVYLADKLKTPDFDPAKNPLVQASLATGRTDRTYRDDEGKRLYVTACASCHYNVKEVLPARPDLAINSATRISAPDNLIQVILNGVVSDDGIQGVVMPRFRDALSDQEIAAIVNYLRGQRAQLKPWDDVERKVGEIRKATTTRH